MTADYTLNPLPRIAPSMAYHQPLPIRANPLISTPLPQGKVAVFFDRDGTLNVEKGYISNLNDLELYPGAAQAVKKLNQAGVLCVLATNQTGAARGYYDVAHIEGLNHRVQELLYKEGQAHLDAVFYSPYYEGGSVAPYNVASACRKPEVGMIHLAQQHCGGLNISHSFVLGDKATDVELANNAGCRGILLKTGYGTQVLAGTYQTESYQSLKPAPFAVCDTVVQAVDLVLATLAKEGLLNS
jgi:D-glycero-D-manno-heptose 1,7-bisphosphate phosphatase